MLIKDLINKNMSINHRGFTIFENKKYKWSGSQDNIYNSTNWSKLDCKVIKIENGIIHLKQSIFGHIKSPKNSPDEIVKLSIADLEKLNINFYK
jgi:hypothetical protein